MNSRLAIITFVDGGSQPDQGLPSTGRPDQGLPGNQPGIDNTLPGGYPGKPDQSLPGFPGFPVQLPVYPFDPTAGNELPQPPSSTKPVFFPGAKFVLKYAACKGFILVPDQSLPGSQPGVDNTLPGSQPKPDQGLPGQPGRPDQGLPPTAQPKPGQHK